MKLSIITINYNNSIGLIKTIESVLNQTNTDFEYIVVDGASNINPTDRNIIESYVLDSQNTSRNSEGFTTCKWRSKYGTIDGCYISEPDKGIYDAMNKGIKVANGEYIQFINSSDWLVNEKVTASLINELNQLQNQMDVPILYGNMLKVLKGNKVYRDSSFKGSEITFYDMFTGTLNHSPVYIKSSLFDTYGLYDDKLKVVSDWKWYMQVIVFGGIKPIYTDIDVIYFDMTGISSINLELTNAEKKSELNKMFPESVIKDYERWSFNIEQIKRLQNYKWAYKLVWLLERLLFKFEKITQK